MSYKTTIEIEGPHENAVESFVATVIKNADDGSRYGVNLKIRRVDQSDSAESVEFSNDH